MTDILPNGIWTGNDAHDFDPFLNDAIVQFCKGEQVSKIVDFGCGSGQLAQRLLMEGFECEAFDGNPNTPAMTNNVGKVLDISKHFDLHKLFDLVISLEVGEHIPKEFEQVFLDNLVRHATDTILLSWALVGQPGHGHVNCQNNDYVVKEMLQRGFHFDAFASQWFRQSAKKLPWFRNTVMLFRKHTSV